jgi:hypothetical protein
MLRSIRILSRWQKARRKIVRAACRMDQDLWTWQEGRRYKIGGTRQRPRVRVRIVRPAAMVAGMVGAGQPFRQRKQKPRASPKRSG